MPVDTPESDVVSWELDTRNLSVAYLKNWFIPGVDDDVAANETLFGVSTSTLKVAKLLFCAKLTYVTTLELYVTVKVREYTSPNVYVA